MDIRFLKVIAIACGNKKLESLINDYTHVIYSTRLCDVWSSAPVRDEYYSKLKATFGDRDPDNMTIEGLIRSNSKLAKEIAVTVAQKGSL